MISLTGEKREYMLVYIVEKWHKREMISLCSRRYASVVPFARTKMHVEGHWSILKLHYLLSHNRPRIDFLVFVISTKLMPKFESDF